MGEDKFTEFEKILMDIVKEAKEEPNEEYDFTSIKIDADCLRSAAKKEIDEEYAWRIYNFIQEWKAGEFGEMPLQEALDRFFQKFV